MRTSQADRMYAGARLPRERGREGTPPPGRNIDPRPRRPPRRHLHVLPSVRRSIGHTTSGAGAAPEPSTASSRQCRVAHVGVYRITHVTPDASRRLDRRHLHTDPRRTLTWSAYLWNYGSRRHHRSPAIALDGGSQTFVPPVMFPLSVTGA